MENLLGLWLLEIAKLVWRRLVRETQNENTTRPGQRPGQLKIGRSRGVLCFSNLAFSRWSGRFSRWSGRRRGHTSETQTQTSDGQLFTSGLVLEEPGNLRDSFLIPFPEILGTSAQYL